MAKHCHPSLMVSYRCNLIKGNIDLSDRKMSYRLVYVSLPEALQLEKVTSRGQGELAS